MGSDFKTLQHYLQTYVERITVKGKSGTYICPLCGSGTGPNKTPAFSIQRDGLRWKCFSCGASGDIFDLIGYHERIESPSEQLLRAKELFGDASSTCGCASAMREQLQESFEHPGISEDLADNQKRLQLNPEVSQRMGISTSCADEVEFAAFSSKIPNESRASDTGYHSDRRESTLERFQVVDPAVYIRDAEKCLESVLGADGRNYLLERGFSIDTIRAFHLGFDMEIQSIVIPYGTPEEYYITRSICGKVYRKPSVSVAGPEPLFHEEALQGDRPVFVVEGQLDAISISEVGGQAVALGGTGYRKLMNTLKRTKKYPCLIIVLDNDEAGRKKSEELCSELKKINACFISADICGSEKDSNDALRKDRDTFALAVKKSEERASMVAKNRADEERKAYLQKSCVALNVNGFLEGKYNTSVLPTEFPLLDRILGGGFFEGLYILGAIPGLGKTSLALQVAVNMAKRGEDVLFISLEVPMSELMAKCVSCETLHVCDEQGLKRGNAKNTREITTFNFWDKYSSTEINIIKKAIERCRSYTDHLFILEGNEEMTLQGVQRAIEQHRAIMGRTPVVMIDYLQLLTADVAGLTDKQAVDRAVLGLKRIARNFKIPVLAISSLSRANYIGPISYAAFKESGGIEYSADVLMGLYFKNARSDEEISDNMRSDVRDVQMKILKNRNGMSGKILDFQYFTKYNYFVESQSQQAKQVGLKGQRR